MEDEVPALCPICGDTIEWCPECRSYGIPRAKRHRTPQEIAEAWENLGTGRASSCVSEVEKS
jgi:hypothetical protein